jgi:ubiquinone/menaquinone biosynthesis C-methylase UbiE
MHPFELEERAAEDAAAADYNHLYHGFPLTSYWDDDFFEFVRSEFSSGDRVLDVGCGPGSNWPQWKRLESPAMVVGVDISERMIEEARRRHPDGRFEVARIHELPFPDGSFDVVIASAVLHHIPDEHLPAAFAELHRVLDEHGRIVGREPNAQPWGTEPGWFSGALMTFRHLVYRLTRSREYPEPELGDHHHPFDAERFLSALDEHVKVSRVEQRFPFSPFVLRVRSEPVARFARRMDSLLKDRTGALFYYTAQKNYATAEDLTRVIAAARAELSITDAEFLAYLESAGNELQRMLDGDA